MSERPKHDSGQVASLTEHRAAKSGGLVPDELDRNYCRGQTILCDRDDVVYFVRVGKVAMVAEIQAELGNRQRVTIDYIGQGEPVLVSRLFPVVDDPNVELVADTDVIVAEVPRDKLTNNAIGMEFLRSFTRLAAAHITALRLAYHKLLENTQAKVDQIASDNMTLQLDQAETRRSSRALKDENGRLMARISSLEIDLQKSREREAAAIQPAREAADRLRELEQRQREESSQVIGIVNNVLSFHGLDSLEPADLMFILTLEQDHGLSLRDTSADEAVERLGQEATTDGQADDFAAEAPTKPSASAESTYSLVGDNIAQDSTQAVSVAKIARIVPVATTQDFTPNEPASSQRGAVMPTPGWNFDDDAVLFETTRDIEIPPEIAVQRTSTTVEEPRNELPSWNTALDSWDAAGIALPASPEKPAAQPVNCPPPSRRSVPQDPGRTTSVWDVDEITKIRAEAEKLKR